MKYVIVGGGITGLSAAYYLLKKDPAAEITLIEKENRLGGSIRTSHANGMLFEMGPRTFQVGRSPQLLSLIQELGLEIIESDPLASKRFLLHNGKLCTPFSLIPRFIPTLIREFFIPRSTLPDESIYDFASRRFSPKMAETFFDPLTLGIFAGDIRKLSIRACFPAFRKWEQEKGSVLRGLLSSSKKAPGLFTIKGGMETLIDTLGKRLNVIYNCTTPPSADKVIYALPPNVPKKSLWVINVAFKGDVLPKKGFGYLVPSQEKQPLLGMIFDSAIFPQQSAHGETRLTAMVRAEDPAPLETALRAIQTHLHINHTPIYTSTFLAQNAIPQFEVGCTIADGVSVDACIQRGKNYALAQ